MKNSENNKLDQLLKNKLAEGSANVPDFVWDNIEAELFPEKKRRGFFWWFFGGACGILFIGIGLFFSNESAKSQTVHRYQKQYAHHKTTAQGATTPSSNVYQKIKVVMKSTKPTHAAENLIHSSKKNTASLKANRIKTTNSGQKKTHSFTKTRLISSKSGNNHPVVSIPSEPKKAIVPGNFQDANGESASVPEIRQENNEPLKTPDSQESANRNDTVPFEQILQVLQDRFAKMPKSPDSNLLPPSRFSIGLYGGPSLYDIAVFKDYFTSGQLSNRTFTSSGFEAGFNARFSLGNRFTIYSGLAFNQKQTQFTYNVAITESDYFTNLVNGNKIPIANIVDNGVNSCFLAKGVTAKYNVSSTLFSLGTTFEFWKSGRFSAAADLRFSCNIQSGMKLSEMTILDIQQPKSERFTYFQPGLGVMLNYRLNNRISLGLAPMFSKQFYVKESFAKKVNELVIPVVVRIGI